MIDQEKIEQSPFDKIQFNYKSSPKKKRVILSENELTIILFNAKYFNPIMFYPFLYMIATTGCRRSEIMNLKWENVDLKNNIMHLVNTKNKKDRTIKINTGTKTILENINIKSDFVLTDENGEQLKRSRIQRLINKFKLEYPIDKNWNYHDLRHSFAYNYLKKGGNMYQLQKLLGHSNIKMTVDLYGDLDIKDIEMHCPYDFKAS